MLKFMVIGLAVLWAAGFLLGGKRRLVRDADHLLRLVLWAVLGFIGAGGLAQAARLKQYPLLYVLAVALVLAGAWPASKWLAERLGRRGR